MTDEEIMIEWGKHSPATDDGSVIVPFTRACIAKAVAEERERCAKILRISEVSINGEYRSDRSAVVDEQMRQLRND